MRQVRASLPITRSEPFEAHVGRALEAARTSALLAAACSALALVLASLGIYAAVYLLGVFFWLKIDATKPVVPDETHATDGNGSGAASGTPSS